MIIGVCYRTPTESIFGPDNHVKIRELVKEVSSSDFLLMGDFNYPGIDWGTGGRPGTITTKEEALFWECCEDNFLTQHVEIPTRNVSTLDLVFTKEPDMIDEVISIGKFADTDHEMLSWEMDYNSDRVRDK